MRAGVLISGGVIVFSSLCGLFFSPDCQASSLQESLQIAFERNPRGAANRQRLEALEARSKAAWADLWPTLNFNYSFSKGPYEMSEKDSTLKGDSLNAGPHYSLNLNLYKGGADHLSAQAADQRLKAQEAVYNSTNALIPNTRGAIANLVEKAFITILVETEAERFALECIETFEHLKSNSRSPEETILYQNHINALRADLQRVRFKIETARRNYEFVVTLPPPARMDSLDEVIESLRIPANAAEALSLALEKSPDILASRHTLEEKKLQYEATRARLNSPRVDLSISHNRNRSMDSNYPTYQFNSTRVMASISWSFSPSYSHLQEAAHKEVEATQSELSATAAELENSIVNLYTDLESRQNLQNQFEQDYDRVRIAVEQLKEDARQGKPVNVTYAINLMQSYDLIWSQTISGKLLIADMKFLIQRTIGTLFDAVSQYIEEKKASR